ncbi:hypothetical protein [Cognatiluteimonas weifangensis]|uniref:Uncharacterized protein n=1 Tax=Cognatiluteimonas weifangensis TaxID=2303539 RepID=A0A372DQL8_9GAMM|nr:hypothetical protein [Luteimonas weifangensis]RFP61860.1 hypothetical protein D0Y53_02010 [Luteimonas weifangensis]
MKTKPRYLLLSAALSAALCAVAPAFAQDTGGDDTVVDDTVVAEASVPAERLAERYAELAGSPEAAADLIDQLRSGGDFTVTDTVTTPVLDANGDPVLDANGNPQTTTTTVERSIVNPNGPLGYGEVNITLSLAQALLESGAYPDLQSALTGTEATVTNPDGTTSTTSSGGVLAMRADGMGWGQIARELGFNLGALVSAGNSNGKAQAAKVDRGERVARADKPERAAKPERPARPERAERPERPQRPDKPERGGGRP